MDDTTFGPTRCAVCGGDQDHHTEGCRNAGKPAVVNFRPVCLASAIHEIDGYGVVLPKVQNYYPVESNGGGGYCWGFKYDSGVFEYFQHVTEEAAEAERRLFVAALDHWHRDAGARR